MIRSATCRPRQYGKTSSRSSRLVASSTKNGVFERVAIRSRSRSTQVQLISGNTGDPCGLRVLVPTMTSPSWITIGWSARMRAIIFARRMASGCPSVSWKLLVAASARSANSSGTAARLRAIPARTRSVGPAAGWTTESGTKPRGIRAGKPISLRSARSVTVTPSTAGSWLMAHDSSHTAQGARPSAADCQLAAARGSEDPRYDRYFRA